jgi:hypothetical protein
MIILARPLNYKADTVYFSYFGTKFRQLWQSLWSSGQSSWLQIQSGFDSWRYQIFWEVVGLERGPLSLVSKLRSYLEENVAAPIYKA